MDHLIISGDISDNASEKDFQIFKRILNKHGFLNGEKVTIVPGNHDIFGGVQKAEEIFTFPEKCSKINYENKLSTFISYFPEAFENCFYISQKYFFPFAKKINETLIIGMNSIAKYSKLNNPFGSNGEIIASQFSEICDLLETSNVNFRHKIAVIHHHFNKIKIKSKSTLGSLWAGIEKQTMKLRNKKRLFNLFNQYDVDIVLHGHIHESREYHRKDVRFLNSGATIKNHKDILKVNFLKINKDKFEVAIEEIDIPAKLKLDEYGGRKNESLKLVNAALLA